MFAQNWVISFITAFFSSSGNWSPSQQFDYNLKKDDSQMQQLENL